MFIKNHLIPAEISENEFNNLKSFYQQYVYRKAVIQPTPAHDYSGKGLAQIEREYGRKAARTVWEAALQGINLTAVKKPKNNYVYLIDFEINLIDFKLIIKFKANQYTKADNDIVLEETRFDESVGFDQIQSYIFSIIKKNIQNSS